MTDKPTTYVGDLARLPKALAPLIERPQWAVWRWTQLPDGGWQKPPFQARNPDRHASTKGGDTGLTTRRHSPRCRPAMLTGSPIS
jgi:hypothetical protein